MNNVFARHYTYIYIIHKNCYFLLGFSRPKFKQIKTYKQERWGWRSCRSPWRESSRRSPPWRRWWSGTRRCLWTSFLRPAWSDKHPALFAAMRVKTLFCLNAHCRAQWCLCVPGVGVVVVGVALVLQHVDEAGTGQEESDRLGQELGQADGGRFLEQSHIDLQVALYIDK